MPLKEGRTLATDETGKKLCEGNWYLYAKSADKSGNSTTTLVKRAFTIDLNNPELSVTGLEEGKTNIISDKLREEIAKELGVYETVKRDGGWQNVSSRDCGNIVTKAIEIANRNVQ